MSILKTTQSGINYAKWLEDLNAFSIRALHVGRTLYHINPKESMWKLVNCKIIYGKQENGNWIIGDTKFRFLATWTLDEFKNAFIERLVQEKPSDCFIEEIPITLEIKVEHEHT